MLKLFDATRLMLWLPFKAFSTPALMLLLNLYLGYQTPSMFFFFLIASAVIMAVAKPIEVFLRPPQRVKEPKRSKPLIAALVRMSQKLKYRSPGRSAFTRSLSPQLKQLLRQPANQKPAAVRFEEAKIAGYRAERSDEPAGAT